MVYFILTLRSAHGGLATSLPGVGRGFQAIWQSDGPMAGKGGGQETVGSLGKNQVRGETLRSHDTLNPRAGLRKRARVPKAHGGVRRLMSSRGRSELALVSGGRVGRENPASGGLGVAGQR